MKTPNRNNPTGNTLSCLAVALAGLAFTNTPALAAPTVWNVNIGTELTTSDNFIGAAPENTANSFWNSVTTANPTAMPLADSTETASTATLTLTGSIGFTDGGWAAVTGPEIFSQWSKSSDNATPFGMEIGGLGSSNTYDLIVYSDWYWKGDATLPVTQTVGSGLAGTIILDQISSGADGVVPGLVEDTDPAANSSIEGNWLRITGLTPDGSGNLAFIMGGTNAAFNGFQLIQVPEPSAAALLGLGGLALLRRRR
ncbi:MAG: PEP-CTERM sorting domain-containing protein [Akkermansiaceae bacterium]|nr:PEP-CTERM sorting domain-containing protein [Akkermansiaceae bacterium]